MESKALKQIKSNNIFDNLKNNYFLEKIFNSLQEKKSLEIIKYNNNIKKRINININNYKEYCEKYSSIEIEIIPVKNKYSRFINRQFEYWHYYHIYFNNTKEEIKRDYINKEDKVSKINIIIDYQIISLRDLFIKCK